MTRSKLFAIFFIVFWFAVIDNSFAQTIYTDTIPVHNAFCKVLRVSPDDHVWVGTTNRGILEFDGSNWNVYSSTTGYPINKVNDVAFDGQKTWIATDSGLVRLNSSGYFYFTPSNSSLNSLFVKKVLFDGALLWVGTDSALFNFDGSSWVKYDSSNSILKSSEIKAIGKNNFGIYVAQESAVFVFHNAQWIKLNYYFVSRFVTDRTGRIWLEGSFVYPTSFTFDTLVCDAVSEMRIDPCETNNILYFDPFYVLGQDSIGELIALSSSRYNWMKLSSNLQNASIFVQNAALIFDLNTSYNTFDFDSHGKCFVVRGLANVANPTLKSTFFSDLNEVVDTSNCPWLDINNARVRIMNNGSNFWDQVGKPNYETPKNSLKCAIFAEGIWMGGLDDQGDLHIAAQTYRQSGDDYWPGPLDTLSGMADSASKVLYDNVWKIDKSTIDTFRLKFLDGSVSNGSFSVPDIILNWPAQGSGNFSRHLAPFVDFNQDGVYDPFDGDYPKIKGDQMIWWIMNDNFSQHEVTGTPNNLGVEIHASAYAFNCPSVSDDDSVINYTTFYSYEIINRSPYNYHDFYMGISTDIDLGNGFDDYAGCDSSRSFAYGYNGDSIDEGSHGYGLNPPMINFVLLKGPLAPPGDGVDNDRDFIIDESDESLKMTGFMFNYGGPFVDGNPSTAIHYYDRMKSLWKDGSPMTYGGTGYSNDSARIPEKFMFTGVPYSGNGWTEQTPGNGSIPNEPYDRSFVSTVGPAFLPANGSVTLDYAYVYTRDQNNPNGLTTSIARNYFDVAKVQSWFDRDSFPCYTNTIGIHELADMERLTVFPSPAISSVKVSYGPQTFFHAEVAVYNMMSELVYFKQNQNGDIVIPIEKLKPGIYNIHLKTKNQSYSGRFIKE